MNKKITFPELVEAVAATTEVSKRTSEMFLKELFAVISDSLTNGENVKIKNFGQFKLTAVNERRSVNVNTGEEIKIPVHTKINFIPDKALADAINMPFASFETVEISENITDDELELMSSVLPGNTDDINDKPMQDGTGQATETREDNDVAYNESEQQSAEPEKGQEKQENNEVLPIDNDNSDENAGIVVDDEKNGTNDSEASQTTSQQSDNVTSQAHNLPDDDKKDVESDGKDHINQSATDETTEYEGVETDEYDAGRELSRRDKPLYRNTMFVRGYICGVVTMLVIAAGAFYSYYLHNEKNMAYREAKVPASQYANRQFADTDEEDDNKNNDNDSVILDIEHNDITSDNVINPVMAASADAAQDIDIQQETAKDVIRYDTITRSRYLTTMSRVHYGDFRFWVYIYEENKEKIDDPNSIAPGTVLVIPPASKYGIDKNDVSSIERAKAKAATILNASGK